MQDDTSAHRISFWWRVSMLVSLSCLMIIASIWYHVDTSYQPNIFQLTSEQAAKADVQLKLSKAKQEPNQTIQFIPTGIYLQSFKFTDSNDVSITGYVWQRIPIAEAEQAEVRANFIFSEQVGGSNEFTLAYQHQINGYKVYGWHFDVTLRQKFSYKDYPLDHKTVWIRLWPAHFDRNIVLLPALSDYKATSLGDTFGLDNNIVIGDWEINETFFDYKMSQYDTSFGFDVHNSESFPELHFNLVLKRKFLNAFVIHLVPLFTVAVLLFALLMTVTSQQSKRETFGFNFTGVISIVSALFFVVMLAHIQVRQQFSEDGIVYIEYFFLLLYFLMIAIICNTYFFSRGHETTVRWLIIEDHLIPKLIYWPITLSVMAFVTYMNFM